MRLLGCHFFSSPTKTFFRLSPHNKTHTATCVHNEDCRIKWHILATIHLCCPKLLSPTPRWRRRCDKSRAFGKTIFNESKQVQASCSRQCSITCFVWYPYAVVSDHKIILKNDIHLWVRDQNFLEYRVKHWKFSIPIIRLSYFRQASLWLSTYFHPNFNPFWVAQIDYPEVPMTSKFDS